MGKQGRCGGCGEETWLLPLHGEKGGPLWCFKCAGAWNAIHGRMRKAARVVIQAIRAYLAAGGSFADLDALKAAVAAADLGRPLPDMRT